MLSLFKKSQKSEEISAIKGYRFDDHCSALEAAEHESLKKNIEAKLKGYRPLEKEANFKGPKIFD